MSESVGPFRLKPLLVERVWGSHDLRPWFPVESAEAGRPPIGEAWLSGDDCVIETGPLAGKTLKAAAEAGVFGGERSPLLVKILFPRDKLSVQVHPDDADAARLGVTEPTTQAKTECWYLLEAEPGATVALGLKPGTSKSEVERAIGDGTLESLMEYPAVAAGEMVYVSAGTIHAIGPGVVILEIQQNSDTTYRLYDYGRPRELHLQRGLDVLKLATDAGKVTPVAIEGGETLIAVPHFTVERYELGGASRTFAATGAEYLIALSGAGSVNAASGTVELLPGEAVVVPAGAMSYSVEGTAELIRCFAG